MKKILNKIFGKSPWVSEAYGFGKWLRIYGYFPSFLPLKIFCEHSGPNFQHLDGIPFFDSQNTNYCYFTHSEFKKVEWKKISRKKAYILPNPFVFYVKKNQIEKDNDAKGTIVYPYHTIPNINYEVDIKKYANELRKLPQDLHPIKVSLHIHDINLGLDKEWSNEGFEVVSAGDPYSETFIETFFSILKQHKLAISNYIGSYIFYSILLDIPFYYYGSINLKELENDENQPTEHLDHRQYCDFYYLDLNKCDNLLITNDQREYVKRMLNFENRISRIKFSLILYKELLFKWIK